MPPLPPSLRYGRQVGVFGFLVNHVRLYYNHVTPSGFQGLWGCAYPGFHPGLLIVQPPSGLGFPAFNRNKRNDRVILPVPPNAGSSRLENVQGCRKGLLGVSKGGICIPLS